jgi:hypothetical protein
MQMQTSLLSAHDLTTQFIAHINRSETAREAGLCAQLKTLEAPFILRYISSALQSSRDAIYEAIGRTTWSASASAYGKGSKDNCMS